MRVQIARSALIVVVGALVGACSEDEDPATAAGESSYLQCLQDAGFTQDEVALFTEPGESGEGRSISVDDHPNLESLIMANAECIVASGIGKSGLTPEHIAEKTAANLGFADCMHSRGWPEFPDPKPGPFGYLTFSQAIYPPDDADQHAQFARDLNDCSLEHLGSPLGGPTDDEGNPIEDGADDHDHGDHDH